MKKKSKIIILYILTVAVIGSIAAGVCVKVINDSKNISDNEVFSSDTNEKTDNDNMFTERDLSGNYDKSTAIKINLKDNASSCDSDSVNINNNTITITNENIYYVTGSLSNGQLIVDADNAKVQIVLDNTEISNDSSAAIYVKKAKKVFITLADGTKSVISNNGEFVNTDDEKIDGAIYSKDDLVINGTGTVDINSNYGHSIVCNDVLKITNGTLNLSAAKKAIKANDGVRIANAEFNIEAEKHGIHCDEDVYIRSGNININKSSEGIEGKTITIDGGDIVINSDDDGLNATSSKSSSSDSSSNNTDNNNTFDYDENAQIYINGGNITINANGDGIDSNGDLTVSGGTVLVYGPENDGNGALDFGGNGYISGGTVVALGMSGMAAGFAESSSQCSMLVNIENKFSGNIILMDSQGNEIININNSNTYNSVVISSPDIKQGETYTLKTGNDETKIEMNDKIYSNASSDFGGKGPGNMNGKPMDGNPPDGETPGNREMPSGNDMPKEAMGEPPEKNNKL